MKFLKHDIDKRLLVLVSFFIILLIIYTVYYEVTFRNFLSKKEEYDKQSGEITAQVILKKLNQTDKLKEIALIDKALLEERYYNLLVKSENLKKEKEALQEEITILKSQLEYQKVKIDGPVAQFRLIQDKNQQLKQLNDKLEAVCSKLRDYNISAEECR